MKKYFLGFLLALMAYPAMAADVRTNGVTVTAPRWDGLYIGVQGGYSFNADTIHPFGNIGGNSWFAGGFIGIQKQYGSWVAGIETDYNWSDLGGVNTFGPLTAAHSINDFGSVRGRLGYTYGNYMLYGTGGLAYGRTEASLSVPGFTTNASQNHIGWTAGAGVESMWGNWLWRAEWRYTDLGSADYAFPFAGPVAISIPADITFHTVTVGLGYKF